MEPVVHSEFKTINLDEMLTQLGEEMTKSILSSFSCPKNKDVENFLKEKAILFSQQDYAKTYLVFWEVKASEFGESKKEFVGYYSISMKPIFIPRETNLRKLNAKEWREMCRKLNTRSSEKECFLSAHLIGQLGKNFTDGNNNLISGQDLLTMAMDQVDKVRKLSGGKVMYVECEKKEKLLGFYKNNGFEVFGERSLDRDETDIEGSSLMQLFKYID